ncbi:acetylcholine receptor subunit alpha [Plakobranchus ocellatus]|uniref:Acetylcholine receptor subunit alpha n=1 Tax=Plakobranchus ocellatus TaxID=259542 RepID=A0AAV3ZG28_9GAST|nr:acetylcholine receptor subunit alpha [Plakobranchus ocellatus]
MGPVYFLSITSCSVFFLPAAAGEKIGLSITVLLTYSVYLTIIAENMPETNLHVSYLATYMRVLLLVNSACVMLSVIVLHIYHKTNDCRLGRRSEYVIRILRMACLIDRPNQAAVAPLQDNAAASSSQELSWPKVTETVDILLFLLTFLL